jgi:hypothetical protein
MEVFNMDVNSVGSIASKVNYQLPPVGSLEKVNQTQPVSGSYVPQEPVRFSLSPEAQNILKNGADSSGTTKTDTLQCQAGYKLKLSADQKRQITKLQMNDLHVRNHEAQHMAVAGAYALGGASYQYTSGPDGRQYAVAGEVKLDASPVRNNPDATIKKAQTVRAAAMAPSDPSGADRAVAASATNMEMVARGELSKKLSEGKTAANPSSPGLGEKEKAAKKYKAYFDSGNMPQLGQLINSYA